MAVLADRLVKAISAEDVLALYTPATSDQTALEVLEALGQDGL